MAVQNGGLKFCYLFLIIADLTTFSWFWTHDWYKFNSGFLNQTWPPKSKMAAIIHGFMEIAVTAVYTIKLYLKFAK